jgi:hypothetical protein
MTRRDMTFRSVAIIALLATTASCGSGGNSNATRETAGGGKVYPTYRYRLTVEVETPEGLRSGSSVIEVATSKGSKYAIPSPGALSYKVCGEAVAVDLGARGALFALLRSDESADWAAGAFEAMAPSVSIEEQIKSDDEYGDRRARALALRGLQVVPRFREPLRPSNEPRSGYPMLVRFTDIADPKTVAKVNPDDLAMSFGKGVKLKRITVERTEDAVTTGIEKRFSWWTSFRDRHFDGTSTISQDLTTDALSASLSSGSFSTEFNK